MQSAIILSIFVGLFSPFAKAQTEPEKKSEVSEAGYRWNVSLGLGFDGAGEMTFTEAKCSGCATDNKVTGFTFGPAGVVSAEVRLSRPWGWGGEAGLMVQTERKIRKSTFDSHDFYDATVQTHMIYGSAIYRLENWYFPFGLNVDMVRFNTTSAYDGNTDVSGGVGTQAGAAYMFNDYFSLEGMLVISAVKLTANNGDGSKVDFGNGYLSSAIVQAKVSF